MLERIRLRVGIEGNLIPVVCERRGDSVGGMILIGITLIRVNTKVVVIMLALKILMHLQHPCEIGTHVRPQHFRCDRTMVGHAYRFADVVTERRNDQLCVRSGLLCQGGGLQTMRELIGSEPIGHRGK